MAAIAARTSGHRSLLSATSAGVSLSFVRWASAAGWTFAKSSTASSDAPDSHAWCNGV
eukprot:CAMPEP_0113580516 /NCGR_PEP_ID=MMETSP0015_2-20120614/30729_1 /TAXON_ID=2838 /ORGANISM="Odontella" /LENGTH=57 /DNA_ID=CAMNT_0000484739 /DNA_START=324 /DNA_END=497 /DNA_ORIENTATION=+ /assembly_acc=CAM_ASM_000160